MFKLIIAFLLFASENSSRAAVFMLKLYENYTFGI